MLYIGCQYQAIKKVKKKESRPTQPKLFTGRNRKHTYFFWPNDIFRFLPCGDKILQTKQLSFILTIQTFWILHKAMQIL